MSIFNKLILTAFIVSSSLVHANDRLSPAALLHKASHAIRGFAPSPTEYAELNGLSTETAYQKVNVKIKIYLASIDFAQRMEAKVVERFKLDANINKNIKHKYFAFNQLVKDHVTTNSSWDSLFTAKKYRLPVVNLTNTAIDLFGEFETEMDFYTALSPSAQITETADFTNIEFSPNDVRVAGIFTTSRFFIRYPTNGINKNRKRAAAIFDILFCDSMRAAVPEIKGKSRIVFESAYPELRSNHNTVSTNNEALHGSDPGCQSCHYKLDPIAQTLIGSGALPSSVPFEGALTFKRGGQVVNYPVRGLGELIHTMTLQPEYTNCQVEQFWSWFIDDKSRLTSSRRTELVALFETTQRRIQDFVFALTQTPEFQTRNAPSANELLVSYVRTFLEKCDTCHTNDPLSDLPSFAKWPIENNMSYWIKKISEELDLQNMGQNRTMPPNPTKGGFNPTRAELETLNQWIQKGAPDESGRPQL